jgi:hypothetical protein
MINNKRPQNAALLKDAFVVFPDIYLKVIAALTAFFQPLYKASLSPYSI